MAIINLPYIYFYVILKLNFFLKTCVKILLKKVKYSNKKEYNFIHRFIPYDAEKTGFGDKKKQLASPHM